MINHMSVVQFGNKTRFLWKICTMVSRSFIHIKYTFSNLQLGVHVSEDSDTLSHKNGSLLFLLWLIIGKLQISKILIVRAHTDKVKPLTFHFHTERSRNQQHF